MDRQFIVGDNNGSIQIVETDFAHDAEEIDELYGKFTPKDTKVK